MLVHIQEVARVNGGTAAVNRTPPRAALSSPPPRGESTTSGPSPSFLELPPAVPGMPVAAPPPAPPSKLSAVPPVAPSSMPASRVPLADEVKESVEREGPTPHGEAARVDPGVVAAVD